MLVTILAACHTGRRKTIIATNSDNISQKVEYTGWISFNIDKTAIESMSPRAYFKYNYNDEELIAKSDSRGNITYEMNDGSKTAVLSNENKQLLVEAIKFITSQKHLPRNNDSY